MTLSVCSTSTKFYLILAALIVMGTGCQTMFKSPISPNTPMAVGNTSGYSQQYTIEQSSNWSNPTTTREPFSGPIPLQKVLEKSGATRRYGNLDVTVVRVSKNTGQLVRMKAKYDPKSRAIEPQFDYDILADDHVIIKPNNSSPIDDMIKPLNKLVGVSGN